MNNIMVQLVPTYYYLLTYYHKLIEVQLGKKYFFILASKFKTSLFTKLNFNCT